MGTPLRPGPGLSRLRCVAGLGAAAGKGPERSLGGSGRLGTRLRAWGGPLDLREPPRGPVLPGLTGAAPLPAQSA